jgi:hypothetical protein
MSKLIELGSVSRETKGSLFSETKNPDSASVVRECDRANGTKNDVLVYEVPSGTSGIQDPTFWKNCVIQ